MVNRLQAIAARSGRTVAQLAIAWVLANPVVTSAIVGVRRPDHILGALPAAGWNLDAHTLREIDAAVQAR
jgi:aryl-alcohol dehydrogenase-like predicted oxidoreductase